MAYRSISELPDAVQRVLIDEHDAEVNRSIRSSFFLEQDQFNAMINCITETILGNSPVLDFPQLLMRLPGSNTLDIRALALRIAIDKLWPLQEFLKNVDVLITRLGGRVPAPVPLPAAPVDTDEEAEPIETLVQGPAKDIIQRYRVFPDLYVTQKPIRDSEDRLKAPTLNNWLQDYLHTVGAEGTGSLKRSKYLSKSVNALSLNAPEKQNLLNFLFSYEDGVPMYWRIVEKQYLLIDAEMPQDQKQAKEQKQSTQQMSELVEQYGAVQRKYQAIFEEKKQGLELEINGNTKKIADIVWDALGLQDTERCLAALDLLIDHHWLLDTLKTDHRFQGIVARSLGVRYGIEAKNTWSGDLTTGVMLAVLWKLLLIEKLGLDEGTAAILSDYYEIRSIYFQRNRV
jgi:hypothetical protein